MQTTTSHYDIVRVHAVRQCRGGPEIVFENGQTVCVPADAPGATQLVSNASAACAHGEHVGLLLTDARTLLDLSPARVSTVAFVRPDEERADRWMVGFWAFGTLCYLRKDHADCERLLRTLQEAAGTETRVLFANHSRPVEDDDESWWQLMDVRLTDPSTADRGE